MSYWIWKLKIQKGTTSENPQETISIYILINGLRITKQIIHAICLANVSFQSAYISTRATAACEFQVHFHEVIRYNDLLYVLTYGPVRMLGRKKVLHLRLSFNGYPLQSSPYVLHFSHLSFYSPFSLFPSGVQQQKAVFVNSRCSFLRLCPIHLLLLRFQNCGRGDWWHLPRRSWLEILFDKIVCSILLKLFDGRGGVEVEPLPSMREIRVRSPIGTDLSR